MWRLLSLVYSCLSRCCRRNETGITNPGFSGGRVPGLCSISSSGDCADRADACACGGAGGFWGTRCAASLLLDSDIPYSASAASDWWRRVDRSPDAARAVDQLVCIPVPGRTALLVTLPPGIYAA